MSAFTTVHAQQFMLANSGVRLAPGHVKTLYFSPFATFSTKSSNAGTAAPSSTITYNVNLSFTSEPRPDADSAPLKTPFLRHSLRISSELLKVRRCS
jgi:hypothetical protein